jgi:hypothetical protein
VHLLIPLTCSNLQPNKQIITIPKHTYEPHVSSRSFPATLDAIDAEKLISETTSSSRTPS